MSLPCSSPTKKENKKLPVKYSKQHFTPASSSNTNTNTNPPRRRRYTKKPLTQSRANDQGSHLTTQSKGKNGSNHGKITDYFEKKSVANPLSKPLKAKQPIPLQSDPITDNNTPKRCKAAPKLSHKMVQSRIPTNNKCKKFCDIETTVNPVATKQSPTTQTNKVSVSRNSKREKLSDIFGYPRPNAAFSSRVVKGERYPRLLGTTELNSSMFYKVVNVPSSLHKNLTSICSSFSDEDLKSSVFFSGISEVANLCLKLSRTNGQITFLSFCKNTNAFPKFALDIVKVKKLDKASESTLRKAKSTAISSLTDLIVQKKALVKELRSTINSKLHFVIKNSDVDRNNIKHVLDVISLARVQLTRSMLAIHTR